MARKARVFIGNTSQHVMLKSIDKLVIFKDSDDYETFRGFLLECLSGNNLQIHSYMLMPTFFEFLATSVQSDNLSKFIQSLSRKYVAYYNKKYNRSGSIWDGRYKSSLVDDENFFFSVMGYIEKLASKEHLYSSVHKNLYGKKDILVTHGKLYRELGFRDDERLQKYATLFNSKKDEKVDEFIALNLNKQGITGDLEFIKNLEKMVGMALVSKKKGRPKKEIEKKGKKMYKNLVVLDKEKHKELKISSLENLNFAKDATHIPVLASEIAQVGATFPVVFTSEENPALVSIVSLGGQSLAINGDGKWVTQYVPSFLRRYPFSLASTKENPAQKVILIDEDSELFSKSKGKQLFKKDGEKSEILKHAITFLTSYDAQANVTMAAIKAIADSGILESREISVGEGDEKKVLVNGFRVVDREKLNALSDDILADWVRKGIIAFIDAHLKSLNNIQTLFEMAQARQK